MLYVFAGSFSKLHEGHLGIANYVEQKFGTTVTFEICRKPFDKLPLTDEEIEKRLVQFRLLRRICCLTNNTSFMQRAVFNYDNSPKLNPTKRVFIVGYDTILRVDDKKYYFGSDVERLRCIKEIAKTSRFLVFSRGESDRHLLSKEIREICDFVEDFIPPNISSTEIRKKSESMFKSTLLRYVQYGTCVKYNNSIYKLINDEAFVMNQSTMYNGEEFIRFPWETVVEVTDLKLWPKIN